MDYKEESIKREYIYNGKVINLRVDDVKLPNGNTSKREIIEHNGGSAILCEKDGKILLERQFRFAYGEEIIEIPAGKVNKGEDPKETAFRELEEECGLKAEKMELLFTVYPSVGYTNEIIRIYKAEGFKNTKTHFDEDEYVECFWVGKDEIRKMIDKGEIKDSKTLIALLSVIGRTDEN